MRASSTILAAAAVILAAGSAASAAPGAAAGFRPLMPAPRSAALWRGPERRPVERDRRLDRRGFGTELGELGAVGPMQAETPIGEAEAAPQARSSHRPRPIGPAPQPIYPGRGSSRSGSAQPRDPAACLSSSPAIFRHRRFVAARGPLGEGRGRAEPTDNSMAAGRLLIFPIRRRATSAGARSARSGQSRARGANARFRPDRLASALDLR